MKFEYDLFLSFHLADPAGILFFGHVFTLAHQIYEQFVYDHLSIEWKDWFYNGKWFIPIKHTEATYHKPLLAGDRCKIDVFIEEVKNSSFSLTYHFYQEQVLCCTVKTTHVFCDRLTQTKQIIPQSVAEQLALIQVSFGSLVQN